jgi:DNA repair protein RadD
MIITPRDYQQYAIDSVINYFSEGNVGNPIIAMPTGCHAKGHMILMFDGSLKAVETVILGDLLMGPDSLPRTVLSLARGRQEMRLITPVKGESFIVNIDHKLNVKKVNEGGTFLCRQQRNETITVRDFEDGTKWYRHLRKLRRVEVSFSEKSQPLDSYFVGLMLGDGSLARGVVNFTGSEKETLSAIKSEAFRFGCTVTESAKNNNPVTKNLRVVDPCANRSTPNKITKIYRNLELMGTNSYTVFVPDVYKLSSTTQRMEVLAGLLDSDGYYDKKGNVYEHSTVGKQLGDDVRFMARSLGLAAYTCVCDAKLNSRVISKVYRTVISGDIDRIPVRTPYKKAKKRSQIKDVLCTGFSVEVLPVDDYYGFTLNGDHLYLDENFIVHHNTGKSIIIGGLIQQVLQKWPNQRFLMLTHVKELIEQNHQRLLDMWPTAPVGIYSAGLRRKDIAQPIVFGGCGSIVNNIEAFGHRDLVIVDECHLISPKANTTYQKIIDGLKVANPHIKVIGLTATPYRLGQGLLTDGGLFTDVCCDACGVDEFNWFIEQGHLAPLIPKPTLTEYDIEKVGIQNGDFKKAELEQAVNEDKLTFKILEEMVEAGYDRKSWLIFASGIKHTERVAEALAYYGITASTIHSKIEASCKGWSVARERLYRIEAFKNREFRALVNMNVLTTGFDHGPIDLIGSLRPTVSPGLHVQMLGRGTRPCEGKENCLVLDFAGNVKRLGPINDPVLPKKKGKTPGEAPIRICPQPHCGVYNHASARICFNCGFEFPIKEKLTKEAGTAEIIKSNKKAPEPMKVKVFTVSKAIYKKHHKAGSKPSLQVTYFSSGGTFKEFVCLEHKGYARTMAINWWKSRHNTHAPLTIDQSLDIVSFLKVPASIRIWVNKKYPEIMSYEW